MKRVLQCSTDAQWVQLQGAQRHFLGCATWNDVDDWMTGVCSLAEETMRNRCGLNSLLMSKCMNCLKRFKHDTSTLRSTLCRKLIRMRAMMRKTLQ